MLKEVLIIFPDPHLSYSPSTLNLYDSLSEYFKVTIITSIPDKSYSDQRILVKNVKYLNSDNGIPLIDRLATEVKKTFASNTGYVRLLTPKAKELIKGIKEFQGIIIAVDFFALWCAQEAGKKVHFVSLEIPQHDAYRSACDLTNIHSVIIQTIDRYKYLFGQMHMKTFIVQNAPKYIDRKIDFNKRSTTKLICLGSALPAFGIFNCIEFIMDYSEYTLVIKGAIPPSVRHSIKQHYQFLLDENRLILNDSYLEPNQLNSFLSECHIGFVFYDACRFDGINTFNFHTAPSGKLFQYYNAGVPVVTSNISGLNSVKEFGAGIMISSLNARSIKNAITQIDNNYYEFAENAKKAAAYFDFSKSIEPFVTFLKN